MNGANRVPSAVRRWLLVVSLAAIGCDRAADADIKNSGTGEIDSIDTAAAPPKMPGDPGIVPHAPIEFPALQPDGAPIGFAETKYADGTPTHYADGSPTYFPDGTPIDYRPRNYMMALTELPTVYLRDDTGEQMVFAGDSVPTRIDPASGAVCWLAHVCTNPSCPGYKEGREPNLYAPKIDGVVVGKSGDLVWPGQIDGADHVESPQPTHVDENDNAKDQLRSEADPDVNSLLPRETPEKYDLRCPLCQQITGGAYELPDTAEKRAKLEEDLARVRAEQFEQLSKDGMK